MSLFSFYWAPEGAEMKACVKNTVFKSELYLADHLIFKLTDTLNNDMAKKSIKWATEWDLIIIDSTIRFEQF